MSVVVFDGKTLAADSFLATGNVMATHDKVGRNEHYDYAYVGTPSLAQAMVSMLYMAWPAQIFDYNEWSLSLADRLTDDGTRAILLPRNDDEIMWILEAGQPALRLIRQPYYLGADDGQGIFNYCKSMFHEQEFAVRCVTMCCMASENSPDKFAQLPVVTPDGLIALEHASTRRTASFEDWVMHLERLARSRHIAFGAPAFWRKAYADGLTVMQALE